MRRSPKSPALQNASHDAGLLHLQMPAAGHSDFFYSGTRNQSLVKPRQVPDGVLLLDANPNDAAGYGMPCEGDSESPVFRRRDHHGLHRPGPEVHQPRAGPASGWRSGPRLPVLPRARPSTAMVELTAHCRHGASAARVCFVRPVPATGCCRPRTN